ncbi:MAG: hypothetical protein JWM68_900 [Verrucomicrobiales bacterium]|nr:hypothetical protein [Verrucomicrobiales bacterium]
MSGATKPNRWSARRWCCTILILFCVQVLAVFLISHKGSSKNVEKTKTTFRLLTKPLSEVEAFSSLFATDPTVFVLASSRGFSGGTWLKMPAQDYAIADWDEPARWLELNREQLGSVFTNFLRGTEVSSLQIAEKLPARFAAAEESPRNPTASRFLIEGALNKRPLLSSLNPPVWPHTDILRNSIVQISVSGAGDVVLARLLSRSGFSAADQKAVAIARELRFKPVNNGDGASNLTIGKVIFQWETVPAPTNAVSEFE